MMGYSSMSYWDAYRLPVPFRKWLIRRYNKHAENKDTDPDQPMTPAERMKAISQSKGYSRSEQKQAPKALTKDNFFTPTRNK